MELSRYKSDENIMFTLDYPPNVSWLEKHPECGII